MAIQKAAATRERKMSDMPSVLPKSSHAPPRRDRGGQNTCLDIPFAGVCRSVLSREQWQLVVYDVLSCSRSLKISSSWIREVEDQTCGLGCELRY